MSKQTPHPPASQAPVTSQAPPVVNVSDLLPQVRYGLWSSVVQIQSPSGSWSRDWETPSSPQLNLLSTPNRATSTTTIKIKIQVILANSLLSLSCAREPWVPFSESYDVLSYDLSSHDSNITTTLSIERRKSSSSPAYWPTLIISPTRAGWSVKLRDDFDCSIVRLPSH